LTPIEFLTQVWGEEEGYVFLPYKGDKWHESKAFSWPTDRKEVNAYIERHAESKDLYYCPNLFSKPKRQREYVKPLRWLYADLDPIDPRKIGLKPTIAIQSSPGRHQALWRLARTLAPPKHEDYNRRLTYAIGADKGGWDLTQVLRIPGTRNHKYPGRVKVRLRWSGTSKYTLTKVKSYLDGVERNASTVEIPDAVDLLLPSESAETIRKRVWDQLDNRGRSILDPKADPGDPNLVGGEGRSGVLWELECRLLEAGLEPEEVFVVVKQSVWNKFEDRRDSDIQLWREVQKAHLHVGSVIAETVASGNNGITRARPRLLSYADLLGSAIREPEWAIEDWWTLGSHGIIAGLPKSYKSLISTDMAVSLASETPFLGQYEVNPRAVGPVLIVQQENSLPILRDRLLKISHNRGLQIGSSTIEADNTIVFQAPPAIPILFYNDFGFNMTMPDDQEAVETVIRNEGIKTIFFDPLYLMIGGADENKANEMRPILVWLLRIRNLYNCAVVVIHHWGKGAQARGGRGLGGTRLLGSTTIYGWLEAALYLEARHLDSGVQLVIEREFRERPSPPPLALNLIMGEVGETVYGWNTTGPVGSTNRLLEAISGEGPRGATLAGLRAKVEWGQKKLRTELDKLIEEGIIAERQDGRVKRIHVIGEVSEE